MKYLTTLEVAHELKVSKQTLLNWLYAGKIPEPPRNRKGYRLWSPSRVSLVKKMIVEGRLHKRTIVHHRREGLGFQGLLLSAQGLGRLLGPDPIPKARICRTKLSTPTQGKLNVVGRSANRERIMRRAE